MTGRFYRSRNHGVTDEIRHIINRGFKLKLRASRRIVGGKAKELIELGATPCLSLGEVASDVEILITT